jgi:hypothetical protein
MNILDYQSLIHLQATHMSCKSFQLFIIILSRVLVTETGFGLVFGFINRLQLVTTNNSNTVPDIHNLQTLHYNHLSLVPLVFTICFLATDLNTRIITDSHFKVFNSHDPLLSNYEPFTVVSHLELTDNCSRTSFTLSYKPLIWHAGKGFNCCVTADAVTWPPSCVIQVFIAVAWQQTRRGDERLVTARNRGSVFRCYSSCMAQIRHNIKK